jgi:hypothetical protein
LSSSKVDAHSPAQAVCDIKNKAITNVLRILSSE